MGLHGMARAVVEVADLRCSDTRGVLAQTHRVEGFAETGKRRKGSLSLVGPCEGEAREPVVLHLAPALSKNDARIQLQEEIQDLTNKRTRCIPPPSTFPVPHKIRAQQCRVRCNHSIQISKRKRRRKNSSALGVRADLWPGAHHRRSTPLASSPRYSP